MLFLRADAGNERFYYFVLAGDDSLLVYAAAGDGYAVLIAVLRVVVYLCGIEQSFVRTAKSIEELAGFMQRLENYYTNM